MVLLTTTPQIINAISSLPSSALENLFEDESVLLPNAVAAPISHRTLISISHLTRKHGTAISLDTLLRGTRPYTPPPPPKPEPSPEYIALMTRLKQEQEQREYAALLSKQRSTFGINDEEEDPNDISVSLVFNVLLSVVLCAVAVFQLTKWWNNDGVRVLLSLSTGLAVGVAEVGLYWVYLLKVGNAKDRERRKKEKKTLIGEYRPTSEDEAGLVRSVKEAEHIWGKGANGGMRRRVRERWEKDQKE